MIGTTGATGQVGSRVARRLADRGDQQRLLVRDASRAPDVADAEVVRFGGYSDEKGMRQAFAGLTTLFLASAREAPDRVEQHKSAIEAATDAGVQRIVYLSFIGAAPDATFTFARDHFHTEQHIRASGLAFTFSRQSLYLDFLPTMVGEDGVIRGPAGDGRLAPVLRDDVAESLSAMLAEPGHEGAIYELTGPEALALTEVAAQLSELSGRSVTYESETLEEARASRAHLGAPAWELEGWVTSYAAVAAGELDVATDHVRRLTGHEPMGVREFLSER